MPSLHLASHRGERPRWDEARGIFLPERLPGDMAVAGAANGEFTLAEALAAGQRAGIDAALALGFRVALGALPATGPESAAREALWQVHRARGKAFVDLQNDVTTSDIDLARQEGFTSVEHLKRYTTLGMATDQGKTSGVSGIALLAASTGRSIATTGTTTFRPPYTPVALGALAGPHRGREFRPTRLTPSHAWAERRGAVFVEAGEWLRAQYFPEPGEKDWLQSVTREASAVRNAVGVCDVSTLGKIDVQGPDALALLERVYANKLGSLAVGRARYALMLREDGIVMDDGTVARIAPDRYFITTTTANAGAVWQHLQFCHQVLWPELDAQLCSVTEQWAQFAVAGPRSRALLERIADAGQDLSNSALPYLAAGPFSVLGGVRGRVFRLSFSGELAYEIAVPAQHGEALVEALFSAGADLDVTPYGTETLGVLRIEKGHPAGGELSGQTTAHDLGLGRLLAGDKDYIGAVLAQRAALTSSSRARLVGIKPANRSERLYSGAHFIAAGAEATAAHDAGYVTSVAFSPALGYWIGVGLLANGPTRHGETLRACDPLRGRETRVEICDPVFVDPEGGRLRG
jgi:sarcosine oxidase subunit alpha